MFGGGRGSFGAAPPTTFGTSVQSSPSNHFQSGNAAFGGPTSGDGGIFGGSNGTTSTSFGGSGGRGGRSSFSASRGGRTSSRGGRNGGGGRHFGSEDGFYSGGRGGRDGGRGGRGGRGSFGSSFPSADENPFAQGSPSSAGATFGAPSPSQGNASSFGQPGRGRGRGGGRFGGRGDDTVFGGGAASVQPNIRRKSDFGGRGPRQHSGTSFGQVPFIPPLPPSSPPPLPQSARKAGRGGIVNPLASAPPISTTFGQPSTMRAPGGFALDSGTSSGNPFGGASIDSTRTTFGRPQSADDGSIASVPRVSRETRQPNAFTSHQGVFHESGGMDARFTGGGIQNQQPFAGNEADARATFGRPQRKKSPMAAESSTFFGSTGEPAGPVAATPTLKPRKKTVRGAPEGSPPPTPIPSSIDHTPVIGDQKNKAELASAENLDGTCVDMCSPEERGVHIRVDELSVFEKCFPGDPGRERDLVVKRFQRSSADHKLDIPSELRPLGVLRSTQLYLEQQIMDRELLGPDPRFNNPRTPEIIELYNFCWDRFRMIRKDFVLQNYRGAGGRVHPIAVDVHERIARYHILSEHELCEVQSFVAQQNMEQLGQTLKSLSELYDESRKLGDPSYLSPFEAEFRAYFILCTLDNGRGLDVLKFVKGLAPQVREAAQVKFAMQIFVARHTQDYYLFFKLLRKATYLQACLVFRYIPSMRSIALERMNRAFRNQPYPLADLAELLCFDDLDHAESVCSHHGLDISASDEGDGELLVNFGGEFDTDTQLRQNKNPLPARRSHVYVGQKKGEFLRRDVCRGVTEYEPKEYPMLSKLIEDTETQERAVLYPKRPPYEDVYSAFALYSSDPYAIDADHHRAPQFRIAPDQGHDHVHMDQDRSRMMSFSSSEEPQHELLEIARKQAEVEQKKMDMMRRIEALQREKEEQKRKVDQSSLAAQAAEREADAKAQAEAEALQREQAMQDKIREEEAAREREQQERETELRRLMAAKKAAAEQARAAELQRAADEKRRAEEEQRRRDLQRVEDERKRKAAADEERRRKAEHEAEQARLLLAAKRRAELAREEARRKQVERVEKQRLAVLKLKFYSWKKFVAQSKALPRGVQMEASSIADRALAKPHDVTQWLFGGTRAASDFIGLKRRDAGSFGDEASVAPSAALWRPLDVASITGQSVVGAGRHKQGWKFVVADVLDEGLSSFGSWTALKCGISSASLDEDERISTVHAIQWSATSSLAVCCRYLDGNFLRTLSPQGRAKKLAGTSSLLLPLDLSHVLDAAKVQRWEERVRGVLAHLHPARQVGIVVLGFCASNTPRKGDALAAAEAAIQRMKQGHQNSISFVDGELILEEEMLESSEVVDNKIAGMIYKMASVNSETVETDVVDFAELVDAAVDDALADQHHLAAVDGLTELQDRMHRALWKLRDVLHSPAVIDIDAPIPELQTTLGTPSYGWNSRDAQHKWESVFKTLTSHRIFGEEAPVASSKVCEVYFEQIVQLVDSLFAGNPSPSSGLSTAELKQALYGLLVPVHEELVRQGEVSIRDASRILPWRQIFRQILGAFVECLDETLIYVPTAIMQSLKSKPRTEASMLDGSFVGSAKRRSRNRVTLDTAAQAAAVAFARRELKRAFAGVPAMGGVKRLRQEIARDRASSQSYQQFLRREMGKWSSVDGDALPLLS